MIFPLLGKEHIVFTHTKKDYEKIMGNRVPMFVPNVFITI